MAFKIIVFAAAVFASQANAQLGLITPFATGFTNGISEMAKPFVELGESVISPSRKNPITQWMSYPAQMIPQVTNAAYEGYETVASAIPGASYFQMPRPKPQVAYYPIASAQATLTRPPRPYPAPAPAPATLAEEANEIYRPTRPSSNLLIQPEIPGMEVDPEAPMTISGKVEVPTLQRPIPVISQKK